MGVSVIGGLLTSLFLTLAVVPAAYDLFDDGQDWLRRGEFRKLVTLAYWKMRIRQVPALLGKIRQAPGALMSLWSTTKQAPQAATTLGRKISSLIKRKRNGSPPDAGNGMP
jgi:hypothetical protein